MKGKTTQLFLLVYVTVIYCTSMYSMRATTDVRIPEIYIFSYLLITTGIFDFTSDRMWFRHMTYRIRFG